MTCVLVDRHHLKTLIDAVEASAQGTPEVLEALAAIKLVDTQPLFMGPDHVGALRDLEGKPAIDQLQFNLGDVRIQFFNRDGSEPRPDPASDGRPDPIRTNMFAFYVRTPQGWARSIGIKSVRIPLLEYDSDEPIVLTTTMYALHGSSGWVLDGPSAQ